MEVLQHVGGVEITSLLQNVLLPFSSSVLVSLLCCRGNRWWVGSFFWKLVFEMFSEH